MYTIKLTPAFESWLAGLKDNITRLRLARRPDKAQQGNLGDVKSIGSGLYEMREHFGSGWRMYFLQREKTLIVMHGGGDKSSQSADIKKATALAATIEE
ncbi:type II toxin-antitoxin system RelE/ParE family toxin [Desulfocastanea catecholica]